MLQYFCGEKNSKILLHFTNTLRGIVSIHINFLTKLCCSSSAAAAKEKKIFRNPVENILRISIFRIFLSYCRNPFDNRVIWHRNQLPFPTYTRVKASKDFSSERVIPNKSMFGQALYLAPVESPHAPFYRFKENLAPSFPIVSGFVSVGGLSGVRAGPLL